MEKCVVCKREVVVGKKETVRIRYRKDGRPRIGLAHLDCAPKAGIRVVRALTPTVRR